MSNTLRGAAEMTVAMAISGTIGWFVIVSRQPVMDVVFWRCVFAAATLLVICAATGLLRRHTISARQLALAAVGGVAVVINWLLLFGAYSRASISIATAVYNTQPFMLVGLGAALFAERLTAAKLTWLCVAFAGMLMIVMATPNSGNIGSDYLTGIAMALGAAFFYAVAAIIAKKLKGIPPQLIILIQVSVGALILAPFAHWSNLPASAHAWAALGTLGAVHTGLAFILLYGAIQKLPTNLVGSLSFVYPLVAILVDLIAFGHRLQPAQIAGATAILLSAAGVLLGWSPFQWHSEKAAIDSPGE
jgi:drug/metabolite transporter (DMT)-like permease